MLFVQDSLENIRIYDWTLDLWYKVISINADKEKIFIQNIQDYAIYGFRIDQK